MAPTESFGQRLLEVLRVKLKKPLDNQRLRVHVVVVVVEDVMEQAQVGLPMQIDRRVCMRDGIFDNSTQAGIICVNAEFFRAAQRSIHVKQDGLFGRGEGRLTWTLNSSREPVKEARPCRNR
ncbi:hypothetical protein VTN00DRAFT_3674 [Thermoascus crustaceus]|uniref:uncharacterized protein n=1 Tax=Thermoascus crustaceus TaxID=5088 RepID=UPI003744260D